MFVNFATVLKYCSGRSLALAWDTSIPIHLISTDGEFWPSSCPSAVTRVPHSGLWIYAAWSRKLLVSFGPSSVE